MAEFTCAPAAGSIASRSPGDDQHADRAMAIGAMTPNQFRRIALGMSGAVEGSHMAHPDFRANGKIFATLYPDHARGMVKLTPDQQQEFIRASPEMFEPASGAWGRQGCTTVKLATAEEGTVGEAMTLAWQATIKPVTPRPRKRGQTRSPTSRGQTRNSGLTPRKTRRSR
jgi:hypothetical protein